MKLKRLLMPLGVALGLTMALMWFLGTAPDLHAQGGARIIRVSMSGMDVPNCGEASIPCRTVQYAVDQAEAGDEILIAAGVYNGVQERTAPSGYPGTAVVTQVVYISKTLTMRGGYTTSDWSNPDPQANPTVIDAQGQGRGLFIGGDITVTVEGLSIIDGDATGLGGGYSNGDAGGGVYIYRSTAIISATTIYSNVAQSGGTSQTGHGGGLYAHTAHVTLLRNQIVSNTASATGAGYGGGAGFYGYNGGAATLISNTVLGNRSSLGVAAYRYGYGGGLSFRSMEQGAVLLERNFIQSNTAMLGNESGYGGGLYFSEVFSGALISNTIRENIASRSTAGTFKGGYGGGIWVQNSPLTLMHNTILGNTGCMGCSGSGGGMWVDANIGLSDNTIGGNIASLTSRGKGGGLYFSRGADVVQGNVITGNTASRDNLGYGGGVYFAQWSATFGGNTVADNIASWNNEGWGGGLYVGGTTGGQPALAGNQVFSNTASVASTGHGGGLFLLNSYLSLMTNTIAFNVAGGGEGDGGGVHAEVSDLVFSANRIYSNTATSSDAATGLGGGLYGDRGSIALVNNLVADNHATTAGSGLYFVGRSSTPFSGHLAHNTIADNHSSGEGVYAGDYATLLFTNTIIAGHATAGVTTTAGAVVTMTATLWHGNGSDVAGPGSFYTATNLYGDPAFADPSALDYHLRAGSPAMDAGVDAGVTTDFEGDPRPAGSGYDLGADEYYIIGVQLAPDHHGVGSPVRATIYTHTLTNTGNYTDTFAVTWQAPPGWTVQVVPNPVTLGGGATRTLSATITPPSDAVSGTVGSVVITATSQADVSVAATVTDTTLLRVWHIYIPMTLADYGP